MSTDSRTVLVTGVTSGIGKATAHGLARQGHKVLAVARDNSRGTAMVEDLVSRNPGLDVDLLTYDLSLMASVRELASEVKQRYGAIDVLINNAGVAKVTREVTREGFETMFAVNHLAPFLLTNLLVPALEEGAQSRVVNVTSEWHERITTVPWDDLQREREFKPTEVYNSTKLMNVWFTRTLVQHVTYRGIAAYCVAPGFLRTNLTREAAGALKWVLKAARPFQKPPEVGAERVIRVATSAEPPGPSGSYFNNGEPTEPSPLARDDESARRLWELSAELCGLPLRGLRP